MAITPAASSTSLPNRVGDNVDERPINYYLTSGSPTGNSFFQSRNYLIANNDDLELFKLCFSWRIFTSRSQLDHRVALLTSSRLVRR